MAILDRLSKIFSRKAADSSEEFDQPGWGPLIAMLGQIEEGEIGERDYSAQAQRYKGTAYACIRMKAEAVAATELCLYAMKKNGEPYQAAKTKAVPEPIKKQLLSQECVKRWMRRYKAVDIEELTEHPGLDILEHVNKKMTRYDLLDRTVTDLELHGIAYWLLGFDSEEEDRVPIQMWNRSPRYMTIKQNDDGSVKEYIYKPGKVEIKYKADEVICFWYPGPNSDVYGFPPIVACSAPGSVENKAWAYQNTIFENMGTPQTAIISKHRIASAEFDRLKAEWKNLYQSYRKTGKTAFLEGEIDIEKLGFDPTEMGFVEGLKVAREFQANVFGVPISKLTMESSNRAVQSTSRMEFYEDTIQPICTRIQQELTESLAPFYDEGLFYAFVDVIPTDITARVQERKTNLSVGYSPINEERAIDGKEPVPGGDVIRVPMTMVEVGGEEEEMDEEEVEKLVDAVITRAREKMKR